MEENLESIEGYVDHIIYRNADNGYTVLVLVCNEEEETCVGVFSDIAEGENIKAKGSYTEHPTYGRQFQVKSFEEKRVIKGADYSFEKGKIYGLLGRNGAGKTTLFNCISGEMDFDSGKIYMTDEENSESMNYEKIGYVYSTPILPEFLTGYEFIRLFTDINKKKIKNIKTPEEYADMVCFDRSDLDKLIKGYSHGMKNKMQMLINIIAQPPVFLLDEPLTFLVVVVAEEMKQYLRTL